MARVTLRGQLPQLEDQVVAVRADQGHTALDLLPAGLAQGLHQGRVKLLAA